MKVQTPHTPECSKSREMQTWPRALPEAKAGRPEQDALPERKPAQRAGRKPRRIAAGGTTPNQDRLAQAASRRGTSNRTSHGKGRYANRVIFPKAQNSALPAPALRTA